MKVIGPALGGVIRRVWGRGNFFVQGVAYVGVLVMIYLMHAADIGEGAPLFGNGQPQAGLRVCLVTPAVLALMTLAYVPRIFAVPYQTLMPVFQKDVLKVGPEGLGFDGRP